MRSELGSDSPGIVRAFADYDREVTLSNIKVGCLLGIVLMPAGVLLDWFVYPQDVRSFLELRLLCSALIALFWMIVSSSFGHRQHRKLGVTLAMIPASFIAWMIYAKDGADSPYYAGLNLVLLVVGFVLHWTFVESLVAVSLTMAMYLLACFFTKTPIHLGHFFNNLYFLILTGIIVVTGSYFHSRLRFREFALRYQLDENRRQLEETNRRLTELDQIKSRFFANISHELRTPLTLLLAPLEAMIHRYHRAFDEPTRNLLQTMQSNGMRLLKLINDLLDLVRLDSGVMQVKREAVELDEFLRGLASAARQMADDKRIRLETSVTPEVGSVMVDKDKLEKIILNLQFNALKFTPAGGRVELRARRQDEELILQVADTGMGISAKNLPHVFDRFWQADTSSKRKYQGVGIGLALVKELVEVQGGKVAVDSQEGAGTTFTVCLPFLRADPTAVPAPPADDPVATPASANNTGGTVSNEEWLTNLYRRAEMFPSMTAVHDAIRPVETPRNDGNLPKALIADDEPDMLRFLKSQLSSHYQIIEAVDGQQAIEKASQFLPDVILLDMMMPEKDGLQACRELRQRTTTQSIPVILLTARADEETKLAALNAGANDFLPKPFSTTELHVRVKNLVESYQYQRKLSRQNQTLESTIEQLKETETQLVQTEKLASLGRLSAGIIHEINNPLNFATTGLYTLRNKARLIPPEQRDDYAEILKDVEEGINRVKTIVSDLRTFTHPGEAGCDSVDVREVATSALRFLSQEWKDKVEMQIDLAPAQTIWAEKNKLIQILINLLQNSLDALKRKEFKDEKPTIVIRGRVERGLSILSVRDNGGGIDSQIMDKIFDPFFTTKDVGQGMGLGLSICYRIVQDFEGRITVSSESGKFCEFALEFPLKQTQSTVQP